jgi:hypothetical protein
VQASDQVAAGPPQLNESLTPPPSRDCTADGRSRMSGRLDSYVAEIRDKEPSAVLVSGMA